MALQIHMSKNVNGVRWKSGHIYSFSYTAWTQDPTPTVIYMYSFSGTHPTTGREWRFHQCINFSYLPRPVRRQFAQVWLREWQRNNGNMEFTWNRVLQEFPQMKDAVRRYFYTPSTYITKAMEIPLEDMEDVIVSTWSKDFSKKVKASVINKYKQAMKKSGGFLSGFFGR